jgi:hypothetical protein
MATEARRDTLDDDPFNDDDLLDFEAPEKRQAVAAKMRRTRLPGTVTGARAIMFLQPLIATFVPVIVGATRGDDGAETAATTTTTVAAQQQQGGGGGAFLLIAVLFLGLVIGLIVVATRLGRITPGIRTAAIGIEAVVLLGGGAMLASRIAPMPAALTVTAVIAIGLLLSRSAKAATASSIFIDTSARFDIRSLPTFDR